MLKFVTVETVLGCNLRCPECACGTGMITRKHGNLSFAQFALMAKKLRAYCDREHTYMYLHLNGEPMLNPDIFAIIKLASAFSRTNISTNANTLSEKTAEELITSGVSDIIVSIDGMTQEIYGQYRRRGNLKKALENLVFLVEYNNIHHRRVNIMPQFCCFAHNEHEIPMFVKYCQSLGLVPELKAPFMRENSEVAPTVNPMHIRKIAPNTAARLEDMKQCQALTDTLTLLLDGTAVACCCDYNGVTNFGNIFTQPIEEIFAHPMRSAFIQTMLRGKIEKEGDALCPIADKNFVTEYCLTHCVAY